MWCACAGLVAMPMFVPIGTAVGAIVDARHKTRVARAGGVAMSMRF